MKELIYLEGDILHALRDGEISILAHQGNAAGAMGAGLAKSISKVFSGIEDSFKESIKEKGLVLGDNHYHRVWSKRQKKYITIANMIAQESYGRDGKVYTNRVSLASCLHKVMSNKELEGDIGIPYCIGCGLGGEKWNRVEELLIETVNYVRSNYSHRKDLQIKVYSLYPL